MLSLFTMSISSVLAAVFIPSIYMDIMDIDI